MRPLEFGPTQLVACELRNNDSIETYAHKIVVVHSQGRWRSNNPDLPNQLFTVSCIEKKITAYYRILFYLKLICLDLY